MATGRKKLSKRLLNLSKRLKKQQLQRNNNNKKKFRQTRPSNYPLSSYVLDSFLENPPPGFKNKNKKKLIKNFIKYKPEAYSTHKITSSNYLDDDE